MPTHLSQKNIHKGRTIDTQGEFRVIDCRSCKFFHIVPLPDETMLATLYKDTFYSHAKPFYFKDMEEDLPWWQAHYKSHYKLIATYAPGRKLLDIGSGPGHFLVCGKKLGWDVLGFEPSKQAAAYAQRRGVRVINDLFSAQKALPYGPFDVVYLYLILEHIPDPTRFLKEVKSVLKPGGVLVVISPNDYNPLQLLLRTHKGFKPWWVAPPQHLNYFTFASIQHLLKRLGFSVLDSLATFPMEFFLLSGDNYIGKRSVGRRSHAKRKTFELAFFDHEPEMLTTFYRSLAKLGIGREFVIISKKRP